MDYPSGHKVHDMAIQEVPPFSEQAFLDHLVCFIVADDQVCPLVLYSFTPLHTFQSIRVVECPEFRQLCMVLRESLTDKDIPGREKMKESILNYWRASFEGLKLELSVS